ncbi:MAG: hypothetical protein IKU58_01865 [Clostridia bacterium]|nr:hypothetical protein [Clostridia bacterium]
MHMPKRNLFAYLCATALGVFIIVLAFRGQFDDLLGNIILGIIGAGMVVSGIVTIIRHLREKKDTHR